MLRHMSCFQTLVALCSGEAECYASIREACTSLGIQSHKPRLDDRNSDTDLQRQFSGKECCKKAWNWRTSETLADTALMAAEPNSSWPLEVGGRCRRTESSGHTHVTSARSQNARVVRVCWSVLDKFVMDVTTVNRSRQTRISGFLSSCSHSRLG